MEQGKKVTIYDIAREGGVSAATVSRVITGNANVREEKKKRVEELIQRYDFRPNVLAKSLKEMKSRVIGIILIDIVNPFYASVLSSCEKQASKIGYSLVVSSTVGKVEQEGKYLNNLYEQRVGAIINVGGQIDELYCDEGYVKQVNRISHSIPIVSTGHIEGTDCYQVKIDERKSMELAVEHLLSLGHRQIALLGGRSDKKSTVEKRAKYIEMMHNQGIVVKDEYISEEGGYDDKSGYERMNRLLDLPERPTAVIAINDFSAVGAVQAIWDRGLRIPEDISITSFDDTFIASICRPKLTSVSYDFEQFGKMLIDTAVSAMMGEEVSKETIIVPKLIVRDSCAEPVVCPVMVG